MKTIQILGPGCARCNRLEQAAEKAASELGIEHRMEKITDVMRFADFRRHDDAGPGRRRRGQGIRPRSLQRRNQADVELSANSTSKRKGPVNRPLGYCGIDRLYLSDHWPPVTWWVQGTVQSCLPSKPPR
jgi:hypothetical protein